MSSALAEPLQRMSAADFRAFQLARPDHERWELWAGVPVQMSPALLMHNRIADNLVRLLDEALAVHDPTRIALQRSGIEVESFGDCRPEPDVAVLDAAFTADQRFMSRAYLLAEVVSSTDRERVPGRAEAKLEAKRRLYRSHPPCEAILSIEQDRVDVLLETRVGDRWTERRLKGLETTLALPSFGLTCTLGDLYGRTPLGTARPRG